MQINKIVNKVKNLFFKSSEDEKKSWRKGIIKYVNYKRGYGFIKSKNHDSIFVHFNDAQVKLKKGKQLKFNIRETQKGLQAVDVQPV